MEVKLSPKAAKYLKKLDEPLKSRILRALRKLEEDPPQGDIKNLTGRAGYRLRVGQYRVLFDITDTTLIVYEIGARGQIYKD